MTAPANGLGAGAANLTGPPIYVHADISDAVTGLVNVSQQYNIVPLFDGHNLPLNDFVQDVRNAASLVPDARKAEFLATVISKISGDARRCLHGRALESIDDVIRLLQQRLTRGKDFDHYCSSLANPRMRQDETLGQFYDRIRITYQGSRNAWKRERGVEAPLEASDPVAAMALRGFINALPTRVREIVNIGKPANLDDAFEQAETFILRNPNPSPLRGDDKYVGHTRAEYRESRSRTPSPNYYVPLKPGGRQRSPGNRPVGILKPTDPRVDPSQGGGMACYCYNCGSKAICFPRKDWSPRASSVAFQEPREVSHRETDPLNSQETHRSSLAAGQLDNQTETVTNGVRYVILE